MPIQSSFAQVASQIVAFNRNIVETLSKINSLSTTTDPSVNVDIIDIEGVSRSYSLPSFTFLSFQSFPSKIGGKPVVSVSNIQILTILYLFMYHINIKKISIFFYLLEKGRAKTRKHFRFHRF